MPWRALVVVAAMAALPGCKGRLPGAQAEGVREAQQATALAWVNAFAARDDRGPRLRALTADALLFRTMGADKSCEGPLTGDAAFAAWFTCTGAKPDLQELFVALKVYRDALRADPNKKAELGQSLPWVVDGNDWVVDGNDAWSRYRRGEQQRVQPEFSAFKKEAGNDGAWTTIATSWLYTMAVFRVQVVGAAESLRVHAVLVDVSRSPD